MATDNYIEKPIVYYDGQCSFCHSFVRLLSRASKAEHKLNLLPYQLVTNTVPVELMLVSNNSITEAGMAALKVLHISGGVFKIAALLLKLLPAKTLNNLYYAFARNRYRLFGQTSCPIT
ncbi:DCC1-like thiol-disulfide oxidoreductase family protein [Carboxylicivirga sp. RSCT41]|uniref:DCC1-like thiol-disulfide oxidoreductase family protein n=1 Tax=Carboxylicivirga agarovorans TaxID=3417570 RepID=UPI003D330DC7